MSEALKVAQENYDIALNHFNYADEEHSDKAIEELNKAENNLNRVIKELKENK